MADCGNDWQQQRRIAAAIADHRGHAHSEVLRPVVSLEAEQQLRWAAAARTPLLFNLFKPLGPAAQRAADSSRPERPPDEAIDRTARRRMMVHARRYRVEPHGDGAHDTLRCDVCKCPLLVIARAKQCSACRLTTYCGLEHQETHWYERHRFECKDLNGSGLRRGVLPQSLSGTVTFEPGASLFLDDMARGYGTAPGEYWPGADSSPEAVATRVRNARQPAVMLRAGGVYRLDATALFDYSHIYVTLSPYGGFGYGGWGDVQREFGKDAEALLDPVATGVTRTGPGVWQIDTRHPFIVAHRDRLYYQSTEAICAGAPILIWASDGPPAEDALPVDSSSSSAAMSDGV